MPAQRTRGTVSKWLNEKGYGWISCDDDHKSAFIHHSEVDVSTKGRKRLDVGERVEFTLEQGDRGWRALSLVRI